MTLLLNTHTCFRMHTMRQGLASYSAVYFTFCMIPDTYLLIPVVRCHHDCLHFVWQNKPCQWKVLPSWMATDPRVFTSPILSIVVCLGLFINFSKSELCLSEYICFLWLVWDIVDMCISLPTDKHSLRYNS